MNKIIITCGMLIIINPAISQIYYKEIVYVFNYTIEESNKTQKGIIYLGCLGKPWPFEERQAAVIWTTKSDELNRKVFTTGIYEEKEFVWLHPPRQDEFSILEYSPFPQIRFPVSNNMTWKRSFTPGKNWVNKEFNIKEDDILKFNYINTGIAFHKLKNENLECWEIEAESTNLKVQTNFSGLFNSEYGFVKMVFQNINNSTITLELCDVRNWRSFIHH